MRLPRLAMALVGLAAMTALASAEPLITMKDGTPQPGVVDKWTGSGKKIELTLKEGTDPQKVAAAIESNLDRIRVKVKAGRLLVIGLPLDELLSALSGVELGGDDLDLLAAAAATDDDFDSGSSLRAKKTAKLSKLLSDRKVTAVGRVVAVKSGPYPQTRVAVKVLRGPTGALGETIRKGRTINFTPALKMKDGRPDVSDEATVANIGVWYLKPGDQVQVRVGAPTEGGYVADVVLR